MDDPYLILVPQIIATDMNIVAKTYWTPQYLANITNTQIKLIWESQTDFEMIQSNMTYHINREWKG